MKTKKIVIGVMAAAMLSLSVCSLAPALAADETVQIIVGSKTVEAGDTFTVDVTMADIPAEGIQAAQFSLAFDADVITIDSVKVGSLVDSVADYQEVSGIERFNASIKDKYIDFMWSTSADELDYLLKGEGVFCTITGTVSADAAAGDYKIQVVPTDRLVISKDDADKNDRIDIGSVKDGKSVKYNVKTTDGVITVPGSTSTNPSGSGKYLKGDANEDGNVNMSDATAIVQSIGNKDKYALKEQGLKNAEVTGDGQVTVADAIQIQLLVAGEISEL